MTRHDHRRRRLLARRAAGRETQLIPLPRPTLPDRDVGPWPPLNLRARNPPSASVAPATVPPATVVEERPRPPGEADDAAPPALIDEPAAAMLPAAREPERTRPARGALPPVRANPGPLPDPLPPRLDAVVRALREDLLMSGGGAAELADEICARHRDRLREALGLEPGPHRS